MSDHGSDQPAEWKWTVLSTVAGMLAGTVTRKVASAVWSSATHEDLTPNPADRRVSWPMALGWAVGSAVAVGVSRLVAERGAAAVWESSTGQTPPGIA